MRARNNLSFSNALPAHAFIRGTKAPHDIVANNAANFDIESGISGACNTLQKRNLQGA